MGLNRLKLLISLMILLILCGAKPDLSIKRSNTILQLENKYKVDIRYIASPSSAWKQVTFKKVSPKDRDKRDFMGYLAILSKELNKYPVDFIKNIDLKTIALVHNLKFAGQLRAAVPDFVNEILYLDVFYGSHRLTYRRHVIHHELYHMIEEELNGNVYYKDPKWNKLNPWMFNYGLGGKYNRGTNMYPLIHPQVGFINRYSMTALEEDKAEIFAALLIPSEYKKITKWAKEDEIIKAKIAYMKRFLRRYSPKMNMDFW